MISSEPGIKQFQLPFSLKRKRLTLSPLESGFVLRTQSHVFNVNVKITKTTVTKDVQTSYISTITITKHRITNICCYQNCNCLPYLIAPYVLRTVLNVVPLRSAQTETNNKIKNYFKRKFFKNFLIHIFLSSVAIYCILILPIIKLIIFPKTYIQEKKS